MQAVRNLALVFGAAFACAVSAAAQQWRNEAVVEAGIEFDAPSRLERLPMQLGESALYQRARLRPKDDADFVRARYYWTCDVYVFAKKEKEGDAGDDAELPEGVPEEMKEQLKALMAQFGGKRHRSFEAWLKESLKEQKDAKILEEGKQKRGKSGKLDYRHWEWRVPVDDYYSPSGVYYCEAAVYDFEDREVAVVIEMPLESDKHKKPKSKWSNIIDRMLRSGRALDLDAMTADGDDKRDKFADTPEKQEALAAAKANIQGLQGWDYFTSPNYIVLYSWDFERPDERNKAKKDAVYYSSRLEKMRDLYIGNYPLDGTGTKAPMPDKKSIPDVDGPTTGVPTTPANASAGDGGDEVEEGPPAEKLGTLRYSVFRLCATYDQFMKYGQSPPGVVGWFSPASKELVVFLGGDQMMGSGATETVTYHEGWHQYADFYFDHPETEKRGTLHRWFDEGHGDYFGSFRWGQSGWKYVGSKMRYDDVKQMVRKGDYVPFKEIVHWDRRRFYSNNAPYYYAQAYSMVDFLRRGEKSRGWDPRWGQALDMYRKVMLVYGDSKRASDTAFLKFTDEEWKALEDAWKDWVGSNNFMNGR